MQNIQLTTLDNGLRIITDTVQSMHSVALGLWTGVGTRHEDLRYNGVAHMVEHMLFKGTESRTAQTIAEQIEDVGGAMNAYTSRELTSYHIHVMSEHASLALDILGDMYQHSTLPDDEIEKERDVILQEIGMCNDTPDDLIFDHYYETAYPGQALGAPILGTPEIIGKMSREALRDYIKSFYSAENTVISAAGNLDHDRIVRQVEAQFTNLPGKGKARHQPPSYKPGERRTEKPLEQAHFMLGFQAPSRLDENYYSAQALSIILGGGMSSRLFQEVREKRGLVYSIFSFHSGYCDDGQFAIYAGTGPRQISALVPVICDEIRHIAEDLKDAEVDRAKAQLKANLLMKRESMLSRADQQAKHVLYRNCNFNPEEQIEKIEAVDKKGIDAVAEDIFGGAPTICGLGPLDVLEPYDDIARRLAA